MGLKILFLILGVMSFLFVFWRKLKEDYFESIIFASAFYIIFGIFLGSYLSSRFFPEWWFWLSFLGAFLGLLVSIIRHKIHIIEVFEAYVCASLYLLLCVFLYNFITTTSIYSVLAVAILIILIFLFAFFEKNYKEFVWYKSGRFGFSSLCVIGIFFLIRSFVAIKFSGVVSLVGREDAILSGIIAFVAFLLLFNLGNVKS